MIQGEESASELCLLDYNKEVLDFATKHVVSLNLSEERAQRVRYLSGSWERVLQDDQYKCDLKGKFGLVLMCETLYNKEYYDSLMGLICWSLAEDGVVLLGTKTFYFGFGGGFLDFQKYLNENIEKYGMIAEILEKYNDMKSIERMVVKIRRASAQEVADIVSASVKDEDDGGFLQF